MKFKEVISVIKDNVDYHKPEILLGLGIAAGIACTVSACKATMSVNKKLEDIEPVVDEEGTEVIDRKETIKIVAKEYAIPVSLGVSSIICVLSANRVLRHREAYLAAAYVALEKGYNEYRSRVTARYGAEVDDELFNGYHTETVSEKVTDEDGNETTLTKTIKVSDGPDSESPYVRIFDEQLPDYGKDPLYAETFLRAQQNTINDTLKINKFVSLNEVYDLLGFDPTPEGMTLGWIYDKHNDIGDNYIDFGVTKLKDNESGKDIFRLNFNCDGEIQKRLKQLKLR